MRPIIMLSLGTALGILIGAGVGLTVGRGLRPEPDWRAVAASSTVSSRRAYALPLNNPDMIPGAEAGHMKDEDIVLGMMTRTGARAYPWWLIGNYHVVNDTVENEPLLITLCEVCGGAAAFRAAVPDLPGVPLSFQISGIGQGTIELGDHQTMSRWHPFLGTAFSGPLSGRALERYPVLLMTWKEWKELYPESLVANGSPQLRARLHGARGERIGDPEIPPPFLRSANLTDSRLGLHELVLGIMDPESGKSYAIPVSCLVPFPGLFTAALGGKTVLIARQGELAVTAFDLESTTHTGEFSLVSVSPFLFRGSDGVTWNAYGLSRTPEGDERRLPSTTSYLTEWYEWVTHSPQSEIVRAVQVLPSQL